ncbi:MAG: prepilin-type N-terminal cleavage/methylation domain-containing protein, partial [Planctomycetota bacterium]
MTSEPVKSPQVISLRAGFTMIELMVVVAIIVMASGVMGPTIIDFMKNRELEGVRGQFGNIFNLARLRAVNERRDISVVFFRGG